VTTEEGPGMGVKHDVPSSHLLRFRESSGALRKDVLYNTGSYSHYLVITLMEHT